MYQLYGNQQVDYLGFNQEVKLPGVMVNKQFISEMRPYTVTGAERDLAKLEGDFLLQEPGCCGSSPTPTSDATEHRDKCEWQWH